jgi:hypothetical protein
MNFNRGYATAHGKSFDGKSRMPSSKLINNDSALTMFARKSKMNQSIGLNKTSRLKSDEREVYNSTSRGRGTSEDKKK